MRCDMPYATVKFYQQSYLLGREPQMPLDSFPFWAERATEQIDHYTFNRIGKESLAMHKKRIGKCACELAEYLYQNEGNENKAAESNQGWSVTYEKGVPYRICQRHLAMTGLMYRGSGDAPEG